MREEWYNDLNEKGVLNLKIATQGREIGKNYKVLGTEDQFRAENQSVFLARNIK